MKYGLKRIAAFLLALVIIFPVIASGLPARAASYAPASTTRYNGSPYYIMVNREMNTVTIYKTGSDGYYSVPYKAMICSTSRPGYNTPSGGFRLTDFKARWLHMADDTYGQYASQFYGNYLFHSVCYNRRDASTLIDSEYNALGERASMGCVRLQVEDAKWIYDNCPAGTGVYIYDSSDPGPLGKPEKAIPAITPDKSNGWEPTDPSPENPWRRNVKLTAFGGGSVSGGGSYILGSSVSVSAIENRDTRFAGWYDENSTLLTEENAYSFTVTQNVSYTAKFESAAKIDVVGTPSVTVSGAGSYFPGEEVTLLASSEDVTWYDRGENVVGEGAELHITADKSTLYYAVHKNDIFIDVPENAWYKDVMKAGVEYGFVKGVSPLNFGASGSFTRAMAVEMLARLDGADTASEAPSPFEDVDGGAWYAGSVAWAYKNGIVNGVSETEFSPDAKISRQDMLTILGRYLEERRNILVRESEISYTDAEKISGYALSWVKKAQTAGIVQGYDDGRVDPRGTLTRAEGTAFIVRLKQFIGR